MIIAAADLEEIYARGEVIDGKLDAMLVHSVRGVPRRNVLSGIIRS